MFSRILIANRGEIAVRIMQTCREMGIRSVAVYSTADAEALHVQRADEAFCLGPPPPLESYLNVHAVVEAAVMSGAQAIHPGYGFLAENAAFARDVQRAGLTWIGPPPETVALMGDKVASKQLAERTGLPIIPGYHAENQSADRLAAEAETLGYPLMIKAAAGGGGRGMRRVSRVDDLFEAAESARREARSAFGDDRIFLEKLLARPRHIEIQVMADGYGNVIHLGERDCSVQRRHQKVIEESPSPVLTTPLRLAMGEHAVRLTRACAYVGAGTVEFLFDADRYYFLEMNTRIQVEHPVTEMVTGLDLIRMQIDVAAGSRLSISQPDVRPRGHAIEARIYAEDTHNGFLPATGKLSVYRPPWGAGIRNDVGVFQGASIGPYYDPLLAKLIVHAETREQAVARLGAALESYQALGVTTNLEFLRWVAGHLTFRQSRTDTGFVARAWPVEGNRELPTEVAMAAAAFELLVTDAGFSVGEAQSPRPYNPWRSGGGWRSSGTPRTFVYEYSGRTCSIQATRLDTGEWEIIVDGAARRVTLVPNGSGNLSIREGSAVMQCAVVTHEGGVEVTWRGQVYRLERPEMASHSRPEAAPAGQAGSLSAPMPSTVVKVAVEPGQRVVVRQTLVVLEAMKMEHVIQAPYDGVVREVLFGEGDLVPAGSPVLRMEAS